MEGSAMPAWTIPFREHLSYKEGRLYFDKQPMLLPSEKRSKVKQLYYDPRMPATILPITDKLREKYPNVSKKNVTEICGASKRTS